MVFKNPLNLARSGFAKTFAHYPQSLVAATQSSSASQNHPFGNRSLFKPHQQQFAQGFHNAQQVQNASLKAGLPDNNADNGLAAYYAAWAKHQNKKDDKEWNQFQFAKRIGWKAPTTILEAKLPNSETAPAPQRTPLKRSQTTSDVTDKKSASPVPSEELLSPSTQATPATSTSSVSEIDPYTDHLTSLAEAQRYDEIPVVFESLLRKGLKPTASAYNALLLAAISLPRGQHHVVPKVLDVYADMVRRHVVPDTSTYAILIELLAARALDVAAWKQELISKNLRYGNLLASDEAEMRILKEDDSLSLAVKLFDTSAAVSTQHVFSAETYRLLIAACAELGRVEDMVRVYANMESVSITPSSAIFGPMIQAFASSGDLRSAVECYEEYKSLAISHDKGEKSIVRRDAEVYASVVKAYAVCGRVEGGLKFLGKLEDSFEGQEQLHSIRSTVAHQALYPHWLMQNQHDKVIESSQPKALEMACIDAADKDLVTAAERAYSLLGSTSAVAPAMLAMYLRENDLPSAHKVLARSSQPNANLIEPTLMYTLSAIKTGGSIEALQLARVIFAQLRQTSNEEIRERLEEVIEAICRSLISSQPVLTPETSLEVLKLMTENQTVVSAIAEHMLASFGPQAVSQLSLSDAVMLTQLQASMIAAASHVDPGHAARLNHLVEILIATPAAQEVLSTSSIEQALLKAGLAPVGARLQQQKPTENSWDPYAASTDSRGSSIIAEELEKTHGKSIVHLNEALAKFRNIRRAGRHPRYVTYGKLISAAAKENKLNLAQDIFAMAKSDVPLVANSSAVRHGWTCILDSMVAACLTVGNRALADQYHHELLEIGSAPSANTFGLYITTLKESTKTFDEATEAVKIFHQAKAEGVEPSSFLYNALIGKLGKARRIDDCLFYFTEMRNLGIRPTSVTYGTIVNALCRVSDDKFAEELFEEMESMPNYKPRPAPYNSMMQYFLTTKRDRSKVLEYYERMQTKKIKPTMHTYKLLIDSYATLEPINMEAAESLVAEIPLVLGCQPEAVHYASLIHAKGCVLHDAKSAQSLFDSIIADGKVAPQPCIYQALIESLVANHLVTETEPLLEKMKQHGVALTPYIANSLIHGWAVAGDIGRSSKIFESLGKENREPSTYEAMTRAWLAAGEHGQAMRVVGEVLKRGYPNAVVGKITELVSPHVTA